MPKVCRLAPAGRRYGGTNGATEAQNDRRSQSSQTCGRVSAGSQTHAEQESALIAAVVIALVAAVVNWLLGALGIGFGGGLLGIIINLIVAALILMISDRFVAGMRVSGFGGALIAAIAIAVVNWLVTWLLAQLGLVV